MEIRKRLYGEPLLPLNLQLFAEGGEGGDGGDGAGAGTDPAGNDPAGNAGGDNGGNGGEEGKGADNPADLAAQLEQMKADMAKQKEAINKATKEAAEYKRQLRARQTQEEIDAANKKEAEEKAAQELEELRKKVARAESTKSVMAKLGIEEETAGSIAECLAGCEDIENALLLIQKVWEAKEKKLRLEFGKIPGPGTGGSSEDKEAQAALELAKELGKRKAAGAESVRAQLGGLVR